MAQQPSSCGSPTGAGCASVGRGAKVYRPRRPRESPLWRLLSGHFERFVAVYEERFAATHGPLRKAVVRAVGNFLRCGILDFGFARIRCGECGEEYLRG